MSAAGSRTDPRGLGFHFLTLLAVLVCVVAAAWQWQRAHRTEADAVPSGPVVELADLDPADSFSGMRVRLTGEFDVEHEVLVEPRERDGQLGAWVLTPLQPTVPTSPGSQVRRPAADAQTAAVAVVRGWVPQGQLPEPPPDGAVTVVGVLVADARQPGAAVDPGDPPTLAVVDTGALAEHAGYPVRSGWFALRDLEPPGTGQPAPLRVTELPGADVGLNWQNAAYTIQWVVFAGFVIFFWSRVRREQFDRPVEQESPR